MCYYIIIFVVQEIRTYILITYRHNLSDVYLHVNTLLYYLYDVMHIVIIIKIFTFLGDFDVEKEN